MHRGHQAANWFTQPGHGPVVYSQQQAIGGQGGRGGTKQCLRPKMCTKRSLRVAYRSHVVSTPQAQICKQHRIKSRLLTPVVAPVGLGDTRMVQSLHYPNLLVEIPQLARTCHGLVNNLHSMMPSGSLRYAIMNHREVAGPQLRLRDE